jgi:methylenetetrahydrofolate dehydrogenase (NADP+)/methenyltetrahydrofolate cyclohydrolase
MFTNIIDGKKIAAEIRAELKKEVQLLKAKGVTPGLGVILVGEDPASQSYVNAKEKACQETGIFSDDNRLPASAAQKDVLALINRMNADPKIHGILVQLPLPKPLDEKEILLAINPDKDVDGFHPLNVGRMVLGQKAFLPCTPHGVVQLLIRSGVKLKGTHVVVVGRSNIVGKPLANMLIQKSESANATVTICHTSTKDIGYFTRQADIVVAAAGHPNTITADMIREGAVVIDVGVNRVKDPSKKCGYRLVGDVDFENVSKRAALITPVPGGVGPLTITMLLYNTVESARKNCALA